MNLRFSIKRCIYSVRPLRRILIFWHKAGGQKPWRPGYSVHKFDLIGRVIREHSGCFRSQKLPPGYGFGFDERVVEYPWFFARIKSADQTILDAGSSLNHYDVLTLDCLRNRAVHLFTLADEGKFPYDNLSYAYGDLRHLPYADDYFDCAVSISTLEHVGMDNTFLYTRDRTKKESDPKAHLEAVRELRRVLKPGGTAYITVPFGAQKNHGWLQVFDGAMVDELVNTFAPAEFEETYFKYENGQWNFSQRRECEQGRYFDIHENKELRADHLAASQSVVCLQMKK